jgi:hypothetical protein
LNRGQYREGGRNKYGCYWDVWVSENPIDVRDIECGDILRTWLQVEDGYGEKHGNSSRK